MATTYDYIASNKRRSVILVTLFVAIVIFIGWAFTRLFNYGPGGIVIAVIIAGAMTAGGYYGGDRLALTLARAQGPLRKEDQPALWNMVENLCLSVGLTMPKIYLLPEPAINAFATGRDPQHASLAVTVGAIEKLENEELEGVIAHELSHIKNYDVRFMTLVAVLVGVIAMLSDFTTRSMWWGGGRRNRSDSDSGQAQGILMIVGLVLLILAPLIGQLIKLAVSRKREFLADASGALMTRYPEGLARALEKIEATGQPPLAHASSSTAHLYISNPLGRRGGMANLFSTHPPQKDRIDALRKMGGIGE